MAADLFLSDEYGWTASTGLFEVVLEFLRASVQDRQTRDEIESVLTHGLGVLDVQSLPEPAREELMAVLRDRLRPWAETELAARLGPPEAYRRSAVGHVKVLSLMAADIARTADSGTDTTATIPS